MAFDASGVLPETTWYGTLLKGIFNFSPDATWLQVVVWVGYLVPAMILFFRHVQGPVRAPAPVDAVEQQSRNAVLV